jgi:hypothetical protein
MTIPVQLAFEHSSRDSFKQSTWKSEKDIMQRLSQTVQQPVCRGLSRPLFAFVISSLLLGLAFGCGTGKPSAATSTVATNDPSQLLQQMSEKLAQAQKLSFKVDRKLDPALLEGRNITEDAQIEISVSRPDKFRVKSDSPDAARQFVFDGQNLSIYDGKMNLYATVPVAGTIDEVMAKINEKYGFTPPLAEFILSDPYAALHPRIMSQAYKGKETVDGVECHHLSFGGQMVDSELWIGVADLLPRKLVATFKDFEGDPQLQADFSDWNLVATPDDKFFTFVVPQDADKVEMVTEAQMKETASKVAGRQK